MALLARFSDHSLRMQIALVFGTLVIALDAVLEQFSKPQRQQHRQANHQRAEHQRDLHAQAVV